MCLAAMCLDACRFCCLPRLQVSIPSVVDPSMAPTGKHSLHAYLPATEPYAMWEGVARGSQEYEALKEQRSQVGGCTMGAV